jgi:hypothetical protein
LNLRAALAAGSSLVALIVACGGSDHPPLLGDYFGGDAGVDSATGGFGGPGADSGQSQVTGTPVDTTASCDTGLTVGDPDAASFAKAIGICTSAATDGYGLVTAAYSSAFGSTKAPTTGQWGILPTFGSVIVPREGASLGALSSGYARAYDSADGSPGNDFVDGSSMMHANPQGTAPPGFPKAAAGCQQDNHVFDVIDLQLVLKAPQDATGFQFDFDFYSSEWPNYVCSNFNDAFVAYLQSSQKTDNVSFDANGNPVSVNNGFFDRCTQGTTVGCDGAKLAKDACPGGPSELGGTGFGTLSPTDCAPSQNATDGGATGWLTTRAPVTPGEQFTLDFLIWNAGDENLDSSILIDHFQWLGGSVTTGTTRVN